MLRKVEPYVAYGYVLRGAHMTRSSLSPSCALEGNAMTLLDPPLDRMTTRKSSMVGPYDSFAVFRTMCPVLPVCAATPT